MERLVVMWNESDYECSCDHVVPVVYESAQHLYNDLHKAVSEWIIAVDKQSIAEDKFREGASKILKKFQKAKKASVKAAFEAELNEYYRITPHGDKVESIIKLGGVEFYCGAFTFNKEVKKGKRVEYERNVLMPQILTLDQWFGVA